jgi:hypothetical protein
MSMREILLEELMNQRLTEAPMDSIIADTWEKLGPAPEVDYSIIHHVIAPETPSDLPD